MTSNITVMKLNGLDSREMCTSGTSVQYLAVAVDTVTMRIFWIRQAMGGFELGVADYNYEPRCTGTVNRVMQNVGR